MTIREAGKGIVKSTGGTYQIGFTDLYGEEHETELSAHNMKELEELWRSLCPEFTCRQNSIRVLHQRSILTNAYWRNTERNVVCFSC